MGRLEWFNNNIYYSYISNNISEKQMYRLKYVIKNIDEQNVKIFGHILISDGKLIGVDVYDSFYMTYSVGYEPCGIEIAVFKWINNLGVHIGNLIYEIMCALDIEGFVTRIGRLWVESSILPKAQDLCYASIEEVLEKGLKIKRINRARVLGVIKRNSEEIELNDVIYGGVESYVYITSYTENDLMMLRIPLYTDMDNFLYFLYKNEKIYLYEFNI